MPITELIEYEFASPEVRERIAGGASIAKRSG